MKRRAGARGTAPRRAWPIAPTSPSAIRSSEVSCIRACRFRAAVSLVELHMSVLPVTDGLRRLQEDGLLETRARAGARVRIPTRTDVRELSELREALETQAARLFATRATAAERRTDCAPRVPGQSPVQQAREELGRPGVPLPRPSAARAVPHGQLQSRRAAASCDRWSSETTSSS